MKRYQKILLGFILSILFLLGGIQLYFSLYLDQQVKQAITTNFHRATGNAYHLNIGDLDLSIFGRELAIDDIHAVKKEDTGPTRLRAEISHLNISGIGFWDLFFSQKLSARQVTISSPAIAITSTEKQLKKEAEWRTLSNKIFSSVLKEFSSIAISDFDIRNLALQYSRADLSIDPLLALDNTNIHLGEVTIDTTSKKDSLLLPAKELSGTFRNFRYKTPDSLYGLHIDKTVVSSINRSILLQSIALEPRLEKHQFARRVGHETDRITMQIQEVEGRQLDVMNLNRNGELVAGHISITHPEVEIYRDRRLPFPANNRPPLPQQMIRRIPLPVAVDSLSISAGSLSYSERPAGTNRNGNISFSNLTGLLTNLTNIEERWTETPSPKLHIETDILNKSKLIADFRFPMDTVHYPQQIEGSLQPMELKLLNPVLIPLASVRIEKGRILGMTFLMNLDKQQSVGKVMLRYENLNITLLDSENSAQAIPSWMANTFKVKSNNTGDEPRIGDIHFTRINQKSVFNYWWKSLLSGLKSSIGL